MANPTASEITEKTDLTTLVGDDAEYRDLVLAKFHTDVGNVTWGEAKLTTKKEFLDEYGSNSAGIRSKLRKWLQHYGLEGGFKPKQDGANKRPRVLKNFDFRSMAVPPSAVELPPSTEKAPPPFLAPENWLKQVVKETLRNADNKDADNPRVVPTVFTRISRGGKSRSLHELAKSIKSVRGKQSRTTDPTYNLIQISFNTDSPFQPWENQNPLAAICRRIAFAARKDRDIEFTRFRVFFDVTPEAVEDWLGNENFILIVDELNRLNLDTDVSIFLKEQFLLPAGRGLVFSSHVISLNGTLATYMDSQSNRDILSYKLPDIVTLGETKKNFEYCNGGTLSAQQLLYYGKIPALVYTYLSGPMPHVRRDEIVKGWLNCQGFNTHAVRNLLKSILTGGSAMVPRCLLEFMDVDADNTSGPTRTPTQNYVLWVPYHMRYIFSQMAEQPTLPREMKGCLQGIAKCLGDFKDAKRESGDAWEALFLIVAMVRCMCHEFDDSILPFQGIPLDAPVNYNQPYLTVRSFDSKDVMEFIGGIPISGLKDTISLYYPGHAKFELYDIIIAVWDTEGTRSLYGYQCKEGASLPIAFANEDKFTKSYVIRGDSSTKDASVRRWSCPSESTLENSLTSP